MAEFLLTDYGVVPNIEEYQTKEIQAVLDLCKENGGTVIIPKGRYKIASLRLYSNTTLYLKSGAELLASDVCEDYKVYDIPKGVELRTDMELITQYYNNKPWETYRRAIISVYGGENIKIIGEEGSLIDGDDCADPNGEEGYRGPHGIFITNVKNIYLEGYTISNCGNFMHQIDNCENIVMKNVKCIGASDGTHMHFCNHMLIEDCIFHTGDDCIAGINMRDLVVRRCDINTSCHAFRVGCYGALVEDCKIWGPGIYPHRMSIVQNRGTELVRKKSNTLPITEGRHDLLCVWLHFASTNFPNEVPYDNIVFRNCKVENSGILIRYASDTPPLEAGTRLKDITFENIEITGMRFKSYVSAPEDEPITIKLKNVTALGENGKPFEMFENPVNANIIVE
ncbi:MAG: hypothetical protein J6Q32_04820 [Clostridia bacterium]|nr:hypothetical protein [Clostridia bacterium]